jgi:hypothetical protein
VPKNHDLGEVVASILEQSAITNLLANDKPKVITLSKKDNVNLCSSFAELLTKNLSDSFTLKEIPTVNSVANIVLCRLNIEFQNIKLKNFEYTLDVCQTNWSGVYICFRAWDDTGTKNHGKNIIFKNLRGNTNNKLYEVGNGTWDILSKTILLGEVPLNFSKLDDDSISTLTEIKKKEALVLTITEECKNLAVHVKNILESDQ